MDKVFSLSIIRPSKLEAQELNVHQIIPTNEIPKSNILSLKSAKPSSFSNKKIGVIKSHIQSAFFHKINSFDNLVSTHLTIFTIYVEYTMHEKPKF